MKKYGMIFDCDGTIIDTEEQTIISIIHAIEKVHCPIPSHAQVKNLFGPGADVILSKLIDDDKLASNAFEYFIDHQKTMVSKMPVYPGVRDLLDQLKSHDYPVGMVTGRHERDLQIVLKAHQLEKYFDVIVPDNKLKNPKPDPEGILLAMEKLELDRYSAFYVGDAKTDVEAAKSAGISAIAALWDARVDKEVMRLEKPFFMAQTPADILVMLNL